MYKVKKVKAKKEKKKPKQRTAWKKKTVRGDVWNLKDKIQQSGEADNQRMDGRKKKTRFRR